jgi:hypothetical protein
VHQPQVVANEMMRGFIQRSSREKKKRKSEQIVQQPKKRKVTLQTMSIASFFK